MKTLIDMLTDTGYSLLEEWGILPYVNDKLEVYLYTYKDLENYVGVSIQTITNWVTSEPKCIYSVEDIIKFKEYLDWLKAQPWTGSKSLEANKYGCFYTTDNPNSGMFPVSYGGVRYLSVGHVCYELKISMVTFKRAVDKYGSLSSAIEELVTNLDYKKEHKIKKGKQFFGGFYWEGKQVKSIEELSKITGVAVSLLNKYITVKPYVITNMEDLIKLLEYVDWLEKQPWAKSQDVSVLKTECFSDKDNEDPTKFPQTYKGVRVLSSDHAAKVLGCSRSTLDRYVKLCDGNIIEGLKYIETYKHKAPWEKDIKHVEITEDSKPADVLFKYILPEEYQGKTISKVHDLEMIVGVFSSKMADWLKEDRGYFLRSISDLVKFEGFLKSLGKNGMYISTIREKLDCCFYSNNPDESKYPQMYRGIKLLSNSHMSKLFKVKNISLKNFSTIRDAADYYYVKGLYKVNLNTPSRYSVYKCFPVKGIRENGSEVEYSYDEFYDACNCYFAGVHSTSEKLYKQFEDGKDSLEKVLFDFMDGERSRGNIRKVDYKQLEIIENEGFWLCGSLFIPSIDVGCSKFKIPKYTTKVLKEEIEGEFIKHWITYRVCKAKGIIFDGLVAEEQIWGNYYRCIQGGKICYLTDNELMRKRIKHMRIDMENPKEQEGTYRDFKSLLDFYNLSVCESNSGKEILRQSSMYPVDSMKVIRQSKSGVVRVPVYKKGKLIEYDTVKYRSKSSLSKKLGIRLPENEDITDEKLNKIIQQSIEIAQKKKVFLCNREFESLEMLCKELHVRKKDLDISEELLENKLLSSGVSTYKLTKFLGVENIEIMDFAFKDKNDGYNYFKCLFKDEKRIRFVSSYDLLKNKLASEGI